MPSKNIGKAISKIKVSSKNVTISFVDGDKLTVTNEVLANFYLYQGKELSSKEIKEIKDFSDNAILLKYALSLIRKRHYSEWKMREKLYAKEGNKTSIDKVIKILKNADLINDKMLAEDLKAYLEEKNYGKNKIINYLSNEGIFDPIIKGLRFPITNEKKKAINNLSKLENRYKKYPYENKKQHIYNALISLGFDNDIAISALDRIKPVNEKLELEKLDIDFNKTIKKYSNKYEGKKLKEKIITSLKTKGYKYKDINRKLETYYEENDY